MGTVCKQSLQINITILVITMMKNWVSHILFLRIGGLISYRIPGSAEKGGYSHRTSVSVLCHI